ncbi:hypothetical protein QNI19_21210 [Cytophagaceae bacterium DM2B3-1]|uniref:DUF4421 domain-containing protein n=1 Tax=Xanthocytophaga flava TaxID=3048013 RepID=A0ABT7CRA1_9BACT|nr:hypothetical protein [Xanthocytophaga flavus]MDJ1466268.1 hypothetical protein [Xanthocytophaga flavus]MDJ1495472.1 hypothetical protein [Xanthocytophaga flavus]
MKKNILYLLVCAFLSGGIQTLQAQSKTAADKTDIEYELQFDDPYDINKMWLNFYPFYVDAFTTDFNVGFGAQVNYFWKNKFDFHAHARTTYARFSDFSKLSGTKNAAMKINDDTTRITLNKLNGYYYLELGATYHFKDEEATGESKIVVYTNRYSDRKWAASVPEYIKVASKVRKIMGIRAGGYYWSSSTNLGYALDKQGVNLISTTGNILQTNAQLYTNIKSAGAYTGFQLTRIRNVVVKPKKYDVATNDLIFSAYADIIYAPFVQVEDVAFQYKKVETSQILYNELYPVSNVKLKHLGFRLGMEGLFNRELSWTYGAELGFRPSLQSRGFYANIHVGFAFASKMQQKRQAYQVDPKGK